MTDVVRGRALRRTFGRGDAARRAVDRISLEVDAGQVVLVFGPSGCGKSTLLGMLGGLDRAYEGELSLFDKDVASLSDRQLSRLRGERIGFVFQAFHLLAHLTVIDNVTTPELFGSKASSPADVRRRGLEVLERVGLADRARHYPRQLSGGEQQRVALARAFCTSPEILFADEPTGNLDAVTATIIRDMLFELNDEFGTTLVIVTHDPRLAADCGRRMALAGGRIAA